MKCDICNEDIKRKGIKLGDRKVVCGTCHDYSAMVVECNGCGEEYLAIDAVKIDGDVSCLDCIKEEITEGDYMTWDEWLDYCDEIGIEPTHEGYLKWHFVVSQWTDEPEKSPYIRVLNEMLSEELKRAEADNKMNSVA